MGNETSTLLENGGVGWDEVGYNKRVGKVIPHGVRVIELESRPLPNGNERLFFPEKLLGRFSSKPARGLCGPPYSNSWSWSFNGWSTVRPDDASMALVARRIIQEAKHRPDLCDGNPKRAGLTPAALSGVVHSVRQELKDGLALEVFMCQGVRLVQRNVHLVQRESEGKSRMARTHRWQQGYWLEVKDARLASVAAYTPDEKYLDCFATSVPSSNVNVVMMTQKEAGDEHGGARPKAQSRKEQQSPSLKVSTSSRNVVKASSSKMLRAQGSGGKIGKHDQLKSDGSFKAKKKLAYAENAAIVSSAVLAFTASQSATTEAVGRL